MGDAESGPVRVSFNPQLRVEFRGTVRPQAEPVAAEPTSQTSPDAVQAARQLVTEPAAPPVPVVPPSNAAGWDVSKKLVRDTNGLIVEIAETWRPAAPPA
jgi:hypothetical protein